MTSHLKGFIPKPHRFSSLRQYTTLIAILTTALRTADASFAKQSNRAYQYKLYYGEVSQMCSIIAFECPLCVLFTLHRNREQGIEILLHGQPYSSSLRAMCERQPRGRTRTKRAKNGTSNELVLRLRRSRFPANVCWQQRRRKIEERCEMHQQTYVHYIRVVVQSCFNPFTSKSDQFQISPAASPEI